MQTRTGSMGALLVGALLSTACQSQPTSSVLTGQIDLSLDAPATPLVQENLISLPASASGSTLTIRTTGWKFEAIYLGRCEGACDTSNVDAWLTSRTDALYGAQYGCPKGDSCVTDASASGFGEITYGSCPPNVASMLAPVTDTSLDVQGPVDMLGAATDCSAKAPLLEEGSKYYVFGWGTACSNKSFDDCAEIHGVRFFKIDNGRVVDLGGTSDDRRPVRFH